MDSTNSIVSPRRRRTSTALGSLSVTTSVNNDTMIPGAVGFRKRRATDETETKTLHKGDEKELPRSTSARDVPKLTLSEMVLNHGDSEALSARLDASKALTERLGIRPSVLNEVEGSVWRMPNVSSARKVSVQDSFLLSPTTVGSQTARPAEIAELPSAKTLKTSSGSAIRKRQQRLSITQPLTRLLGVGPRMVDSSELSRAIDNNDIEAVKQLAASGQVAFRALDDKGTLPLCSAARANRTDILTILLLAMAKQSCTALVNEVDNHGFNALHYAVSFNSEKGHSKFDPRILHQLLSTSVIDVNVRTADGSSALHLFCEMNTADSFESIGAMLLERGADVNACNNAGETPLHRAMFNIIAPRVVTFLLKNDATVSVQNHKKASALHYAVHLGCAPVIIYLLRAGCVLDLSSTDRHNLTAIARRHNDEVILSLLAAWKRGMYRAFSIFGDHKLDRIPEDCWWLIAQYAGVTKFGCVCSRMHYLRRNRVLSLTIHYGCPIQLSNNLLTNRAALSQWSSLTDIELMCNSDIFDAHIVHLTHLKHLRRLTLHACQNLTETYLGVIATMNSLTELALPYCDITSQTAVKYATMMPLLRKINLRGTKCLNDIAVSKAFATSALALRFIDFSFSNINDVCLRQLLNPELPLCANLLDISLVGCDALSSDDFACFAACEKLESVDFTCTLVNDTALANFHALPCLKSVRLSNCVDITGKAVKKLVKKRSSSLRFLNIDSCPLIYREEAEQINSQVTASGGVLERRYLMSAVKSPTKD